MAGIKDVFFRANDRCRQRAYQRWHQGKRKRQILRSQIGFSDLSASRPAACVGCDNYHGQAYGMQKAHRVVLICAMHPYGWQGTRPCPDWRAGDPLISPSLAT
ncbi:MAG: hypothetical protein F6J95_000800 [Leptolyngbya sp. SIO1E4]|nr:hypothetical protein [Leptolyngbya sp. SIO1E4]